MAWSWLRRRADRPSGPAPAATEPPATAPVRRGDDWQELPAVQRTLGPLSPVAPLDAFTSHLAAHQNPSFLAPLGHRVDPDGPGGLVTGLASVRPGNPVPYAPSTALAVPAPRASRPAVQRHAITWSTETAAQPAESFAADLVDSAPIEEISGGEPMRAPGAGAVTEAGAVTGAGAATGKGEVVAPTPLAAPAAPALPVAQRLPASAEPEPATEPTAVPIDLPGPGAEPAPVVPAAEVVTPKPPRASASESDAPLAPLLGSPPDAAVVAAETGSAPDLAPAGSLARTTPLPVSRLAADTATTRPTGPPVANAQPSPSPRVGPAVERPTISSSTPVPILQRQLSAVPERRARTSVMPPPFAVELPVVARSGPEPPAGGLPVDEPTDAGAMDAGPTDAGPTDVEPTLGSPTLGSPTLGSPTLGSPTLGSLGEPATSGPTLADPTQGGGLPTTVPTGGPLVTPASSPPPGPAAPTSRPDPASADVEPPTEPTSSGTTGWEPAEPTAPLSGFAARIASLTNPTEDGGPPPESDRSVSPPVQRLAGPGEPLHLPPRPQPSEGQPAMPPAASPGSPEPLVAATEPQVVPTVGGEPPLVQRAAHHPAGPDGEGFELPPAADLPITPASGSASASGAALPVVARLTAGNPPAATSRPGGPTPGTGTAALVPHRPPLAVRSDLSSAVPPPPVVQQVSFTGPGEPSTGHRRPTDPAPVQRTAAPIGPPVRSRAVESPAIPSVSRTVTGGPPVVPTVAAPGRIERDLDPIRLQRRPTSLPGSPAVTPTAAPASTFASPQSSTAGPPRSFAAMFATGSGEQAAEEAEDHPGYTTVQLQTAAEPADGSPPASESTAAPAAEPTPETAAPPAAASAAGAAPTAGVAAAQLDEMARRLFEPLSARLRAELWLDRERSGLVTDARH